MSDVTYGQLDKMVRGLGFGVRVIEPNNGEYRHAETGALIFLPILPSDQPLLPRHRVAVGSVLKGFGIAEAADLAAKIAEVS